MDDFIFAAFRGDLETIRRMLSQGHDPNTRDDQGNIAITTAASREHVPVVALLLREGADPNQKFISSSALSHAVSKQNGDLFRLLVSHPKIKSEQLEDALVRAASLGHLDFVEGLIKAGVNPNGLLADGNALIEAVRKGQVEAVELLIAKGANPNATDREGRSILIRLSVSGAYGDGSIEAVKLLITYGADPFVADSDGLSVLSQSARFGREAIVAALAETSFPLNRPDKNGNTALELAIDAGKSEIVQLLLKSGIDVNIKGHDGQPALVRVITGECCQKKKMLDLLIKNGANPKLVDRAGLTAHERALQSGRKNLVQVLQEFEPNLFQEVEVTQKKQPEEEKALKPRGAASKESPAPNKRPKNQLEAIVNDLTNMIGLRRVKADVTQLVNFLRVQKLRKDKGLSVPEQSLHMVFTGNPGTGKTTIARLIAQIYKSMGILSKGQFVETDRAGLVGGYLGQTAIKTQEVVESALGGVLFIDEAYSLTDSTHGHDMYGQEAVAMLLKLMEDHRDDLIVIVAGYTEPMQKFIRSNPGLQSRFNKFLHFDDYAPAELTEIFGYFAAQGDYTLHPATELKLHNVFADLYAKRDETFGNARLARNLFEKAINAHANRMVSAGMLDEASLVTLYPEDISSV